MKTSLWGLGEGFRKQSFAQNKMLLGRRVRQTEAVPDMVTTAILSARKRDTWGLWLGQCSSPVFRPDDQGSPVVTLMVTEWTCLMVTFWKIVPASQKKVEGQLE